MALELDTVVIKWVDFIRTFNKNKFQIPGKNYFYEV